MKNHIVGWLRQTEKYTRTDMVYLVGQSGWLIVGQAVALISSLTLAWVFANFVEPSDYGIYRYVLTLAIIASVTALTGFGVAIARTVSQNYEVNLNKIMKIKIKFGFLGTVAFLGISLYYLWQENTMLATIFATIAIWIPFYESLSDYQFVLQGKKDFKLQTVIRTLQRTFVTVIVILTIFITKNIIVVTFTYFLATTLSQYLSNRYTQKKYFTGNDTKTPYKTMTTYAKHLSVQNIFFIGVTQLDKVLLFKFLGPTKLAIYLFAISIPNEIQGILGNINSVAFPKLVDRDSRHFKIALLKKIGVFTLILLIPVALYWLAAPYIFKLLFPVYVDSILISQLFVGTILFIPISLIWHYFYAVEDKKVLWFGTFVGPLTLIFSIIILVPILDLVGAVLAVYIRGFVDLLFGLYFFLRK
ncbi:MAG: oligosaccharide flippase family protein [Candidatus Paceibacterota bacterium]